MIEGNWRYFSPSGAITPGGPSVWYVLDWDQRRTISVIMDEEQEEDDTAIGHLSKHIDALGPDVQAVHFSQDGELISVSTKPEDDQTTTVHYPRLEDIQHREHIETVFRSDLVELDRFGANVDLVSYMPSAEAAEPRKAVFKYYFILQWLERVWQELSVLLRLPAHPNIVPIDRIVLDELQGRVVGFTTVYIPGGTLQQNESRVFKLEWLRQLAGVIDDLNLKYGIAHQDVSARNLVINPDTDALMLFDFDRCARIGHEGYVGVGGLEYGESRDDVKGVIFTLYEIITRDTHFRDVWPGEQNIADVQEMEEWVQHPDVKLDHPVSEYREVLNDWVEKRQTDKISHYKEAPECIEWPDYPEPPPEDWPIRDRNGNIIETRPFVVLSHQRRDMREMGNAVLEWERPAWNKLKDGDRVLANGQFEELAKAKV